MTTMDEQKNIPETGCHRNCARRAATHRIERTIQRREEGNHREATLFISLGEQSSHESPHGNCRH